MTSKQRVHAAVTFQDPDCLPILYLNRDLHRSDILSGGYAAAASFRPDVPNQSEWGYVWHRCDETMGQPKQPPLEHSWDLLDSWRAPDPFAPGRMDPLKKMVAENPDRYIMGSLGITGFNQVTFIRGFENVMTDFYLEPENLNLNQPDIFPLARLGKGFRGRVCLNCPIDHQTVALTGNEAEIRAYAARLLQELGTEHGGYIAYIEDYHSVGMSEANYQAIRKAFEDIKSTGRITDKDSEQSGMKVSGRLEGRQP